MRLRSIGTDSEKNAVHSCICSGADLSSSVNSARIIELRGDEADPSATPTDIGVFPVPMKSWINLTVVARDPAKVQVHPANAPGTEKQENSDGVSQACSGHGVSQACSGLGVIENADKTDEAPKERKAYCEFSARVRSMSVRE
jgi:hypothetical protein